MASKRRNGSGSVYQRADGKWVAQVAYYDEAEGRVVKRRRYASSRAAARERLRELREESPAPAPIDPQMLVADYLDRWAADVLPTLNTHGRRLAASTIDAYRGDVRFILRPSLGQVRLARFDQTEATRWLARLDQLTTRGGKPLSQATKRRAFAALSRAMDSAVTARLIEDNPLRGTSRPPAGQQVGVRTMTATEVDAALVAVRGRRVEALTVLVAYTGMRVSEALGLTWADVHDGQVLVRGSKSRAALRSVPLLAEPAAALRAWKAQQRRERVALGAGWTADDLVFTTGTGTPYSDHQARRDLLAALRAAKLPTSRPFHSFRHSLATRLLNRGVPMPVVSQILGHSSIRVTVDTYGHVEPAITADAMALALGGRPS